MRRRLALPFLTAILLLPFDSGLADGKLQPRRDYTGSLEERSQEAIIVFREKTRYEEAFQDLILKISVADKVPNDFAWIVPFPHPPKTTKTDQALFEEIFKYVEYLKAAEEYARKMRQYKKGTVLRSAHKGVKVISRDTVGSYDVTVVREEQPGRLNAWLEKNGYTPLEGGDAILEQYRKRGFVYTCIKVTDAVRLRPGENGSVDLHPLAFRFKTGTEDAAFFPMLLTGLQSEPFSVNLYVFSNAVLNHDSNHYGYRHYGFDLYYQNGKPGHSRPGGGLPMSAVEPDSKEGRYGRIKPVLTKWFGIHHLGRRFYLTNLKAVDLNPKEIRNRDNDLWLFPVYSRNIVPRDAKEGGPAFSSFQSQKPKRQKSQ